MTNELGAKKQGTLQREIGFLGLVLFGVIFMGPASGLLYYPLTEDWSGRSSYIGYIVATICIVLTVLSYQKMVVKFPESGSAYAYATKGINGKVGFMVGWVMLIDYGLIPTFSIKLTAMYFNGVFPVVPIWLFVVMIGIFVTTSVLFGVKIGVTIQLIIGCFVLFFVCFFEFHATNAILDTGKSIFNPEFIYRPDQIIWRGVFQTAAMGILSFVGFDGITTLTEESKVSSKGIAKALMIAVLVQSFFLVSTLYLGSAAMDWQSIPAEELDTAFLYMLVVWTSPLLAGVLVIFQKMGSIAVQIASITSASRLLYAMGRDSVLPKNFFGYLHPKTNTPTNAILFLGTFSTLGALILPWSLIAEVVSFGASVGFLFVNISVISYFWVKKKNEEGGIMRNLIWPSLGALLILYIISTLGATCLTMGFSWVAAGLIYFFINNKRSEAFRDSVNRGIKGF